MFKGQPKGLFALALANTGERFGYYTMLAIFVLFIQAKFGYSAETAGQVYGIFLAAVYFMPFVGGILADKIGYGKCVTIGIVTMFLGYILLSIPTPVGTGKLLMFGALALISAGTGLFKGNLQVMVGNLYDNPAYSAKRDSAFSLFYMAINIGAMFAPSAATAITNWKLGKVGLFYDGDLPGIANKVLANEILPVETATALYEKMAAMNFTGSAHEFATKYINELSTAYNWGFAVACVSLIVSMAIYLACRSWFKHADIITKQQVKNNTNDTVAATQELTPAQTRSRLGALVFVFAVVIFFWMAFHQNGLTLTFFARDYTLGSVDGWARIGFNIWALALIAISVYTLFGIFQSEKKSTKAILSIVTLGLWYGAYSIYGSLNPTIHVLPQQFQQFNPFYVVALTPFAMALFSYLGKIGREPSAPRKIALGMFVAAAGFAIMALASYHLSTPQTANGARVGVTTLMYTYLVLTFAELLLSPMGISFVSKVAPPKYKGMMMGGWFVATAAGNYLTSVPAKLWDKIPVWSIWIVLISLCFVAGFVMIIMIKKLESATK